MPASLVRSCPGAVLGAALRAIVVSCFLLVALKHSEDANSIFHQSAATWLQAHTLYTLVQSVIIYGLIIFRIWRTSSRAAAHSQSSLTPVIKRLLGVGLIYILMCAYLLITNLLASNAYLIGIYLWPPFVGIVFTSLIVRHGRDNEQEKPEGTSHASHRISMSIPTATASALPPPDNESGIFELTKLPSSAESSRSLP